MGLEGKGKDSESGREKQLREGGEMIQRRLRCNFLCESLDGMRA